MQSYGKNLNVIFTYLEIENDGPNQTQHHWWSPVHQIGRIDVHQLDALAGQILQRRVRIAQEMRPTQDSALLHRLNKEDRKQIAGYTPTMYENISLLLTSFSPDSTSSRANSFVPSRKSWIKSAIRSGGTRWSTKKQLIYNINKLLEYRWRGNATRTPQSHQFSTNILLIGHTLTELSLVCVIYL